MGQNQRSAQGWHVAEWGLWGWVETALKLIGIGAGILAFFNAQAASGGLRFGDNPELAAVIVTALLTLFTVGALGIRFIQREVISMAFAVAQFLGHAAVLVALLRLPEQTGLAIVFGVMFILGQIVKLVFLRATGYTEMGQTPQSMFNATVGLAVFYGVLVALLVL